MSDGSKQWTLDEWEKEIVRQALLNAHTHGYAIGTGVTSTWTELPRWKRWVNSWPIWDQPPFIDPANNADLVRMDADTKITAILHKITPPPRCRRCGGTNLAADPAGYYWDAKRYDGAPLLCLDHND